MLTENSLNTLFSWNLGKSLIMYVLDGVSHQFLAADQESFIKIDLTEPSISSQMSNSKKRVVIDHVK